MNTIGHNSMSDDRKRLIFHFANQMAPHRDAVKDHNKSLSEIKAKAKESGISARMLKRFFEMREKKENDIKEEMEQDRDIANWLALPFISQIDMFKEQTAAEDIPFAKGEAASLLGEPCEAPFEYAPDSPEAQAWISGWHEGETKKELPLFGGNGETQEDEEEEGHETFESEEDEDPDI